MKLCTLGDVQISTLIEREGPQPPEYASTHPSDETRIRQLQELMPTALEEYERAR